MIPAQSAIGMLMAEHRVILRVIGGIEGRRREMIDAGRVDARYVESVVDFLRSYADRCHHGKEEDIPFRDLAGKPLSADDAVAMQALVDDRVLHRRGARRDGRRVPRVRPPADPRALSGDSRDTRVALIVLLRPQCVPNRVR
jgi:hypothetical protein